jgi:hypothetical protein
VRAREWCYKRRKKEGCFEDGRVLRWILLQEITTKINIKCIEYIPSRALRSIIIMCKYAQIPYIYYDMNKGRMTHIEINDLSMPGVNCLPIPRDNNCTNIIMNNNFQIWIQSMIFCLYRIRYKQFFLWIITVCEKHL